MTHIVKAARTPTLNPELGRSNKTRQNNMDAEIKRRLITTNWRIHPIFDYQDKVKQKKTENKNIQVSTRKVKQKYHIIRVHTDPFSKISSVSHGSSETNVAEMSRIIKARLNQDQD